MTRNNLLNKLLASASGLVLGLAMAGPALADNFIGAPGVSGGGASAWTVYAFGNAQAVADTFRALNNFASSSLFQSIVGFIAVLGVLAVGISSGFSSAVAKKFIGYIVAVYLICYIFFGVGSGGPVVVSVEVQDQVDMTWTTPVTVPAVVGIPASLISTAGYQITRQIEASFSIPDGMKMSAGAPFNLAAAMLNDAAQANISDPNIASSMAYYVQDCVVPAIANGQMTAAELITSTDFLGGPLQQATSKSIMVATLLDPAGVGTSGIATCEEAYGFLKTAINATGNGAASYLSNASAWAKTPAFNVVNSAADAIARWSSNNGITDGGALVKQSAVLGTFNGAFKQAAAATGNSDFLVGLNVSQAQQQQVSGWIMGAEVFNRTMGYVYAILQVFVFAITPLVLAAAMVPGLGFALLKNFGQILLWLAIWQPMLAIVNFIVVAMQQPELQNALAAASASGTTYGFTLTNMGIISQKTANLRAAALFIGTMVPALSWGLVKGSVDFSRFVGEAVGEKFAHSAAQSLTTGNYSLNQASMDSFTANKHSIGHTGDWGGYSSAAAGTMNRSGTSIGGNVDLAPKYGANATPTANLARDEGGTRVRAGALSDGGSTTIAGNTSGSVVNNAGHVVSAGDAEMSGGGTSVMANISMGGPLVPGMRGGPANPAIAQGVPAGMQPGAPGAPGAPGVPPPAQMTPPGGLGARALQQLQQGNFAGASATVAAMGAKGGADFMKYLASMPSFNVGGNGHTDHNRVNSLNKMHNYGTTGTSAETGTITDTHIVSGMKTNTASLSDGFRKSDGMNITGKTSGADRLDIMEANRGPRSTYERNIGADSGLKHAAANAKLHDMFGGKHQGDKPTSPLGEKLDDLNKQGYVDEAVAREQALVKEDLAKNEKVADDLAHKADAHEKKAMRGADALIAKERTATDKEGTKAHEGAGARAARTLKGMHDEHADKAGAAAVREAEAKLAEGREAKLPEKDIKALEADVAAAKTVADTKKKEFGTLMDTLAAGEKKLEGAAVGAVDLAAKGVDKAATGAKAVGNAYNAVKDTLTGKNTAPAANGAGKPDPKGPGGAPAPRAEKHPDTVTAPQALRQPQPRSQPQEPQQPQAPHVPQPPQTPPQPAAPAPAGDTTAAQAAVANPQQANMADTQGQQGQGADDKKLDALEKRAAQAENQARMGQQRAETLTQRIRGGGDILSNTEGKSLTETRDLVKQAQEKLQTK